MSDIPSFPYRILWGERVVRSVANLTRRDAEEFLALAPKVPVRTATELFPLAAGERGARPPAHRPPARRRGAGPGQNHRSQTGCGRSGEVGGDDAPDGAEVNQKHQGDGCDHLPAEGLHLGPELGAQRLHLGPEFRGQRRHLGPQLRA